MNRNQRRAAAKASAGKSEARPTGDDPRRLSDYGISLATKGLLEDAIAVFREVSQRWPDFFDGHFNLGTALAHLGHHEDSAASLRRAVELEPKRADARRNLGATLLDAGRAEEAIDHCRQAIALQPKAPEAYCNLASALTQTGRWDEAVAVSRQAIALAPTLATAHVALGSALVCLGRKIEAVSAFQAASAITPDHVDTLLCLGKALADLGRLDQAADAYRRVTVLHPDHAVAWSEMGNALKDLGRVDEALDAARRAVAVRPDSAEAHSTLGNVLRLLGQLEQAEIACRQAIILKPDLAAAHSNLGSVLHEMGKLREALERHDRAVALDADNILFHTNRALALLAQGRLAEGWRDYSWRKQPPSRLPEWRGGGRLDGRTLLIQCEQGLGDHIIGATMLPDILGLGGRCVVTCDRRLKPLFARSFPAATVVAESEADTVAADLRVSAFALAGMVRTQFSDFPDKGGILIPDPALVDRWRAWLATLGPGPKIGFSWRGRLTAVERSRYYVAKDRLAAILAIPGATFVNLQYDQSADDIAAFRAMTGVEINSAPGLDLTNDIDGVAALIAAADAVVGPPTSTNSLAGALGKPAWSFAYFPGGNEKEILGRDRMPWFPSVRVETCAWGGDWDQAIGRIAAELGEFVKAKTLG